MAPPPDDYGWAYIDAQRATASADGPSGSLQFRWGSEDLIPGQFSGSADLVFYPNSTAHSADGSPDSTTGDGAHNQQSHDMSGSSLYLYGNMYISGAIMAEKYSIREVTATEIDVSGSTIFGDTSDDTHRRTGSLEVSENVIVTKDIHVGNKIKHLGDGETDDHSDTYLDLTNDKAVLRVGSANSTTWYGSDASGSQNYVMFNGDGVDTDFFIRGAGGPTTTVFNLVASDSDVTAGAQLHISAALGPVTGSGEIHASRFVSNDIFTSGSVHIGGSDPLAQPDEKNDLVIGDHTTPAGKTGNRGMTIASTNTGVGTIRFAPFASANNGEGWIDYSGNTKNMRFGTDGLNTRMTITSTGNVGIGVTDPDTQLEVLGTGTQLKLSYDATNSTTLGIDSSGNSTLTPGGGRHTVVATNNAASGRVRLDTRLLQIGENNTSDVTIGLRGSTNDLQIVYDESAKTLAFDTSDLFIDAANARVGIGTASPVKMLHVAGSSVHGAAGSDLHAFTGDIHLTGTIGVKSDVLVGGTMWVANKIAHKHDGEGSGHSDTYFSFTDDQTVLRVGSANSTQWYGSDSSGSQNYVVFNADGVDTDFFIRGASGPSSTVFNLVASDSDVTAGAQLHISAALGPVTGSGEIHAARFVSNDIFTSGSVGIVTQGSVGIGTSAPLSQPDEKNDLVIGDNTGNRGMTIATAGTGVGTIRFARSANANDGEGWIDYSGNTKKMRFGTDGLNTRMTITSTGDVGINTSSPTCQLDVEGDARFGSVNSGTGSSNVTTFYNTLTGAACGDGGGDIFANQLYVNDIYLSGTATGITATYVSGTSADPRSYSHLGWETSGYLKASGSLTVGTNATIGGLLTTQLLKMPDNTALKILVADGNTFQEVAVAGDATISGVSAGTATVTIAADAVHSTMLNDDCISGFSNIAAIPAQADEFLISDGGVLKAITFSQLEDSIFASVSGDATVAAGGAITIAANAVEGSMLNTDVISAQTAMTGDVADTDEVLISDAGTLKRADFSVLRDAVFNDVSGDATVAAGGALTIGSGKVHGGMLNDDLITAAGNALGSAALAQGDKFLFTDVGTGNDVLMSVTFSNLEDSIFGNVSGDATIAAGGALTIAADAVHASMLNDDCISGFSNIAAIPAQADEFLISDTANGALKAITFDQLENSVFAHISGDATVAAGGALTIAAGAVEGSMVADDLISSQTNIGANALAQADEFLVSDNGTLKAITFSNLEDMIFGNVSGDATVASGGALTIAANAVEGSMLNSNVAGVGIALTSNTLALDLNEVAEVAVNVAADSIAFVDADDSNATKKDTIADLVTAMAGSGLNSPSAGVMGVNVDGTGIEISSDAIRLKDDGVTAAKLNDNIISGQSQLGSATIASADEFLMSDNGTLKAVIFSNLEDSIFASVSGDATIAAGGALTIAADAVHATMLNDDCISGQTELAHADIADADELMISDAGTIKRVGVDSLRDHFFGVVSGDATIADGGALTIAAGAVENSMLADDAVGADQIASDAVTNAKIADGAVDTEHMANLAITNALIDNATIRADKLDISNSTDIGEALADDDVMNIGNTSASANRKTAVSRFKTYTKTDIGTIGTAEASKAVILDASKNIATLGTVGCGAITSTGASTFGSVSGSSLSALGAAHIGGTLTMDGAGIVFNVANSAGTVNLQVNDGAGADTAITLGKNGKVTKIGDDTPSDGQYLSWNATAGKVAWADGLTVWGMSGSDAHYSSTELRTSGDLAVSGSVTLGGISSGTPASSLFLGLDNNNNIVKAAAGGSWYLEDSDGTEVNITADKEVKFIGSGITTNWTDASHGSDADPYDLTFTVDAAQTGITSILATDLKIGEDDQTKIDFETNDEIHFYAANAHEITLAANTFKPATADGIALGAANAEWSDLFLADGGTIQLGDDQEIQLIHEHDSGLIIKRTRTNDNSPVNLTLQTGETSIEGGDILGRLQWQAPDESNTGDGTTIAASMHVQASGTWNASVQKSSIVWSTADAGELYPWMHLHYDGLLSGSNWTVNVDGTGSYSELDVWNRITCAQQENTKIELTPGKMTLHANTATQPQLTITNTEVVVNEGSSGAQDFRVESNGQTHAFFVDSTDNTAQIKFGGGYGDTGVSIGATGSMNLDGVLHAQSGLETGGDLQVGGNDIKDSGGNVVLSFDGDGNLDNDLTIQSSTAATKLVSTSGESTLYMYGRGASMSSGGNIGAVRFYGTEDDGTGNSAQTSYILAETAESAWAYASSLATRLKFAVGINGSTTLEEVFCLDGSNSDYARVGIGTIDPTYLLSVEVDDGAEYIAQFRQHSSTGYGIRIRNADDSSGRHVTFANDGGTNGGHITMNGTTVAYGTFTGYHPASLPASDHDTGYEYGTIVKIASVDSTTYEKSVDYDVAKTTTAQDKAVLGVWAGKMGECFNDDGTPDRESGKHQIFALGDGHVLVCSEGGNIETGDFICSSNMDGYGMLQPDDLLHNYTVARASEPVDWSTEQSNTKLIACTYHAG